MLYPQNGDRIVTIDCVTSHHPVYTGWRHIRVCYHCNPTAYSLDFLLSLYGLQATTACDNKGLACDCV